MTKPKTTPPPKSPRPGLVRVDALPEKPTAAGKQHITVDRAAQLRADPGAWYLWPTRTGMGGVKTALAPFAEGGMFEAATRPWEGKSRTFVRWVEAGSPNGSAPPDTPQVGDAAPAPNGATTTGTPTNGHAGEPVDAIDAAGPGCYANHDLAAAIVALHTDPDNALIKWGVRDIADATKGSVELVRTLCRELAAADIITAPVGATVLAPPGSKAVESSIAATRNRTTPAPVNHDDDPGWVQCPMCRDWLKVSAPYGDRERGKVGDAHRKDRPDCKRKLSRLGAPWPGPA